MEIGRLEIEPGAEWVIYDPVANAVCKYNGHINVDKLGRINASKPLRRGEIEYFDSRFAAEYLGMPRRLANIERLLEEMNNHLKKEQNSS
jgi:hypothetical protein